MYKVSSYIKGEADAICLHTSLSAIVSVTLRIAGRIILKIHLKGQIHENGISWLIYWKGFIQKLSNYQIICSFEKAMLHKHLQSGLQQRILHKTLGQAVFYNVIPVTQKVRNWKFQNICECRLWSLDFTFCRGSWTGPYTFIFPPAHSAMTCIVHLHLPGYIYVHTYWEHFVKCNYLLKHTYFWAEW